MKQKRPTDFRHVLEVHHINMKRLPNGEKDNHPSNLVNCYYVLHFLAHIILANNDKENKRHNMQSMAIMAKKLLTIYGEFIPRGPRPKRKVVDPVAREALLAKRAAAAKERDKKTAAKREAQRSEQEKKDRIAHTKQLDAASKLIREAEWTEEQKQAL
jgi:hypothetical protein